MQTQRGVQSQPHRGWLNAHAALAGSVGSFHPIKLYASSASSRDPTEGAAPLMHSFFKPFPVVCWASAHPLLSQLPKSGKSWSRVMMTCGGGGATLLLERYRLLVAFCIFFPCFDEFVVSVAQCENVTLWLLAAPHPYRCSSYPPPPPPPAFRSCTHSAPST